MQIGKEEIKLFLFVDDIIIYVENPKEPTKNLLELISHYSKVAGYKVNIKKSIVFPCASMENRYGPNRSRRYQEEVARIHRRTVQKSSYDVDNHNGMITHLEPDILECEVKWDLGRITVNRASGGNRIPTELFPILKDDAVKVLHSICQQIWKTLQ